MPTVWIIRNLNILHAGRLPTTCTRCAAYNAQKQFFFKHDKRRTRPQEECFVRYVVLDAHDLG